MATPPIPRPPGPVPGVAPIGTKTIEPTREKLNVFVTPYGTISLPLAMAAIFTGSVVLSLAYRDMEYRKEHGGK